MLTMTDSLYEQIRQRTASGANDYKLLIKALELMNQDLLGIAIQLDSACLNIDGYLNKALKYLEAGNESV
jgi:hypothetical protein